jgi:hypothetical protein
VQGSNCCNNCFFWDGKGEEGDFAGRCKRKPFIGIKTNSTRLKKETWFDSTCEGWKKK